MPLHPESAIAVIAAAANTGTAFFHFNSITKLPSTYIVSLMHITHFIQNSY